MTMVGLNLDRTPELTNPALIASFAGWNDAGEAASAAVRWLVRRLPGQRMGAIDPERYHVFTSTRPTTRQIQGERRITWPPHDIFYHRDTNGGRDLILLVAREPELRWRSYCGAIIELATRMGATDLVTMGAFLADTPHSRQTPITGFGTSEEWRAKLDQLDIGGSNYEGPTGIVGVLHEFATAAGLPSVSVWAAVPHYLPTTANPKAALALLRRISVLLNLDLNLARLEAAASFFERQVDEAMTRDRRATGYLRELERRSDAEPGDETSDPPARLPSADEVIRDIEQFLKSQGPGEEGEAR